MALGRRLSLTLRGGRRARPSIEDPVMSAEVSGAPECKQVSAGLFPETPITRVSPASITAEQIKQEADETTDTPLDQEIQPAGQLAPDSVDASSLSPPPASPLENAASTLIDDCDPFRCTRRGNIRSPGPCMVPTRSRSGRERRCGIIDELRELEHLELEGMEPEAKMPRERRRRRKKVNMKGAAAAAAAAVLLRRKTPHTRTRRSPRLVLKGRALLDSVRRVTPRKKARLTKPATQEDNDENVNAMNQRRSPSVELLYTH